MLHHIRTTLRFGLCVLVVGLGGCERTSPQTPRLKDENVLLVTLDTTRADRIGCYGKANAKTPALDSLARRGVLFERAYAQVPITTASHCTLFSGRFPREHGVTKNGSTALPDSFPTLATVFKERGYATGAFVAAFVLDERFGLGRGFDVYADDMGGAGSPNQVQAEIRGDVVTDRALAWLETVKDERFFCWVHYFDPHSPYDPPGAFAAAADPYDGEIQFMDSQLARLVKRLDAKRLASKTLIVAVGDHGEAFGEHGEIGHSLFLYEPTMHVPLIVVHPAGVNAGGRVSQVVGIIDLFPTLLELFDVPRPEGLVSVSFAALLHGSGTQDPRANYGESLYARDHYGWAEQRSLTLRRWKYISSTRPELYDLAADPAETDNLLEERPAVAKDMLDLLKGYFGRMASGEAAGVVLDASARKGLESLGYAAGGATSAADEFLTPGLQDPKDRIHEHRIVQQARTLMGRRQFAEALEKLEELRPYPQDSPRVHHCLASCCMALGRLEDARAHFQKTVELDPREPMAVKGLATVLMQLGRYEEAADRLSAVVALHEADPTVAGLLGSVLQRLGRHDEALAHLERAFAGAFPEHAPAYEQAADALVERGLVEEAVALYAGALGGRPDHPRSVFSLGAALSRTGRADEAAETMAQAVERDPALGEDLFTLAAELVNDGDTDGARSLLQVAVRFERLRPRAGFRLGFLAWEAGRLEEAKRHLRDSLEADPAFEPSVRGLSGLYISEGGIGEAVAVMRKAAQAAPDNVRFLIALSRLLSTARDGELRDGEKALELGERAVKMSGRRDPNALLALAAALAETGDYDEAKSTANQALRLASGERALAQLEEEIRAHLEAFEAGRPYRSPQF